MSNSAVSIGGVSGLAMSKPWVALTETAVAAVPAQLGVFEIADGEKVTVLIGYAGGREPFGLRSALAAAADRPELDGRAAWFRVELTHAYLTRWQELLMVHQATAGELPAGNADQVGRIGTLTIDP